MIVSTSRGSTVRSFDERRAILTAVKRDRRNPPPQKKRKKNGLAYIRDSKRHENVPESSLEGCSKIRGNVL